MPYPGLTGFVPGVDDYRAGDREALVDEMIRRASEAPSVGLPSIQDRYQQDALRAWDATNKPESFGLGDVVGAPFALLRNLAAPIRRAMGDKRQIATDVLNEGGAGLASLATGVALPERQAGAGEAVLSIFKDNADRKAAAMAQFIQAAKARRQADMGALSQAGVASDIFARNAQGFETTLKGLGEAQGQAYKPALTNAQLGLANTGMQENLASAGASNALAGKYGAERAGQDIENRILRDWGDAERAAGLEKIYAAAGRDRSGQAGQDIENDLLREFGAPKARAGLDAENALAEMRRASAGASDARRDRTLSDIVRADAGVALDQALAGVKIDLGGAQIAKLRAEGDLIAARKGLLDEEEDLLRARGDLTAEETRRIEDERGLIRARIDALGTKMMALGGKPGDVAGYKAALARKYTAQAVAQEQRNAGRLSPADDLKQTTELRLGAEALAEGTLSPGAYNALYGDLGVEATGEREGWLGYGAPIIKRKPSVASTNLNGVTPGTTSPAAAARQIAEPERERRKQEILDLNANGQIDDAEAVRRLGDLGFEYR